MVYRVSRDQNPTALVELLERAQGGGRARRGAIGRLLALVATLPELRRDPHPDYLEALNLTLAFIERNLSDFRYSPSAPATATYGQFVNWVNGYLRFRILDLYRQGDQPLSLDRAAVRDDGRSTAPLLDTLPSLPGSADGLDAWLEAQQQQTVQRRGLLLELYVEQDPDGTLTECHAVSDRHHNCREIVRMMFLRSRGAAVRGLSGSLPAEPKITWRSLARRWQINEQTLHSHWRRRCRPLLDEIARGIDANPEGYARRLLEPLSSP